MRRWTQLSDEEKVALEQYAEPFALDGRLERYKRDLAHRAQHAAPDSTRLVLYDLKLSI